MHSLAAQTSAVICCSNHKPKQPFIQAGTGCLPWFPCGISAACLTQPSPHPCRGIKAQAHLVAVNKRLVRKLARRQSTFSSNMDLLVLMDAGNEGLVRAAQFFKPSYGARFSSYAVPAVQRQIWRAAMKEADMVQIPITWKELQVKAYVARKVGWQLDSYLPCIFHDGKALLCQICKALLLACSSHLFCSNCLREWAPCCKLQACITDSVRCKRQHVAVDTHNEGTWVLLCYRL